MPGFVSHMVMARDVYNKLDNKYVNLDYMIAYSLGGDLSKYSKCRYNSHHKDMDKFIYTMADYIKENNLINNEKIMGVLYGHICHYIMDDTIHPLVRSIDKSCIYGKNKHTLIELYYDNYLVNKRYHIKKKAYLKNTLMVCNNKDVDMMIDYVYGKVYYTNKLAKYYHFNLFLYRRLKNIYQVFGDMVDKVRGLNRFVNNNKDVINNNYESLTDLYDLSVELAYHYIMHVNKYLNI